MISKVAKKFEAGLRMDSPHKQIRDYRLVSLEIQSNRELRIYDSKLFSK